MRTNHRLLAILLVVACGSTLYAQKSTHPDLSGTWSLNLGKSKLSKKTRPKAETLVVTCSGTSIVARYVTDGRESTERYISDGKEKVVREVQGGEVISRAHWKGTVLITEAYARLKMPNQPLINGSDIIHVTEHWKLSMDGRELTIEINDPKQVSVYDKLPN